MNYWSNWQPYTQGYMLSSSTEENIHFNHKRWGMLVTVKAKVLGQSDFFFKTNGYIRYSLLLFHIMIPRGGFTAAGVALIHKVLRDNRTLLSTYSTTLLRYYFHLRSWNWIKNTWCSYSQEAKERKTGILFLFLSKWDRSCLHRIYSIPTGDKLVM